MSETLRSPESPFASSLHWNFPTSSSSAAASRSPSTSFPSAPRTPRISPSSTTARSRTLPNTYFMSGVRSPLSSTPRDLELVADTLLESKSVYRYELMSASFPAYLRRKSITVFFESLSRKLPNFASAGMETLRLLKSDRYLPAEPITWIFSR